MQSYKDKYGTEDTEKYSDIINLSRPISKKHPPMDVANRAAQFSPFAALTGHDAAIKETARLTDKRIELDESEMAVLDEKLRIVTEVMAQGMEPEVVITHFVKDALKEGGAYKTVSGSIKKVDYYKQVVVMSSGEEIYVGDITDIAGDVFTDLFL